MQMIMNYQATTFNIDDDLKNWIDSQYLGFTVCFGIPVYETVKCAIIASSVGYKDNRACVLTEPYVSIYILGDLVPIKLGNKYVVVS